MMQLLRAGGLGQEVIIDKAGIDVKSDARDVGTLFYSIYVSHRVSVGD